ncbi:branched-chain amino acid ABC transporter permease [Bradyrhizobium sp. CCH5-F6]|jgi:branched-chain amino acid transport system permease protein|uniref:branched-chain amino acid ABC transporter permease n=1 Tax=Bradyrhizobium sp. CCH5-F6 TaxID=1768753 RepID=UPI00076ABDDD|nr:branched-chain amino acid ABC transporter permease [Bradyrhizobium sp. CCH5-F6]
MDTFLFLLTDGISNGAVYGLVALSLVIVHTVTRVANIAQGEYLMFGAMTLASMLEGAIPPTLALVMAGGVLCALFDLYIVRRNPGQILKVLVRYVSCGVALSVMVWATMRFGHAMLAVTACTLVLVSTLGVVVYRLTVQPAINSSAVVLVMLSVGVQMVLQGMGLVLWGADPKTVPPVAQGGFLIGSIFVSHQTAFIFVVAVSVMTGLFAFFEFTQVGKALRATAINRRGAQLCGISPTHAGLVSFALAACFSGAGGMLVAPLVTANVDMGFLIGLKGFVGATFGGLSTYPLSIAGVGFVGSLDAFASYGASAFRDAIVFFMVIPVLLWRNGPASRMGGDR